MIEIDKISKDYIDTYFVFKKIKDGIFGTNAHDSSVHVKFFNDGKAAYFLGKDIIDFESHQDCVDFIKIK